MGRQGLVRGARAAVAFVLLTVAFFVTVALVARRAAARETVPDAVRDGRRES